MSDHISDVRLDLALRIAELGTWSWDLATGTGDIDERGAQIVGLPPGDIVDVAAAQRERVHPDDLSMLDREIVAGIERGGSFDLEYRVVDVDGTVRHVASRALVLTDADGRPTGIVGTNRDVTADRLAAEAIRESELRYRTLFNSIDEGFCLATIIVDDAGRPIDYRIDELNPAYERHSGLRDAIGKTARELVPDLEEVWIETYGDVAITRRPTHVIQESPAMGRWFDVRAFPIGEPDSLRIAVLFNDITARVEADQEREALLERERRARAAAEAFLAVMSHELRTPVTSIYGAANLLAREGTRADAAELAHDIVAETERLQRIIDDLLVLSGVERGVLHLSPEPMLLHHAVAEVAADVRRRHPSVTIDLDVPLLPPVSADQTALRQVLHNLLSNAAKYAGAAGPVTVRAVATRQDATIEVLDEGPGPGPDPDALFDLFYRSPHTAQRATGTGIGLYVARELSAAMGGSIAAAARPSGGSVFSVCLPLAEDDDADAGGTVE